jgi:hypothetical protein
MDGGDQLGADAIRVPVLFDHNAPIGLLDRLDQRAAIERPQRADVDHLARDALLLLEPARDLQRHDRHTRVADQREVRALLHDAGGTDLDEMLVRCLAIGCFVSQIRDVTFGVVEGQVLQKDHRVVITNRRL